jgi:hypothetical protein
MYNHVNDLVISKLTVIFYEPNERTRNVQNYDELSIIPNRTKNRYYGKMYNNRIAGSWNCIPYNIRSLDLTDAGYNSSFKKKLRTWLYMSFIERFDTNIVCTWLLKCDCSTCT